MSSTPAPRLRDHLPEYLLEGLGLGLFMASAALFGVLLFHPSALATALPDPFLRRTLMGLAMGLTAITLVYSPLGKRTGAHLNPATTLTFFRLGKIAPRDALGYGLGQFAGGVLGLWGAAMLLGGWLADPQVSYVATRPGVLGTAWAFAAEVAITFLLMSVVLRVSQSRHWNRWTGLCAGALVWLYITLEAPVSGMSMNPARTLASALVAGDFTALWIYFTAPPLGMLLAAEVFVRSRGLRAVLCAKLHHDNPARCVFRCGWGGH
jgi:aquaporin Z